MTRETRGRPACHIDYDLLAALAAKGMTQDEISALLKISPTTFRARMKDDAVFAETYRAGRTKAGAPAKSPPTRGVVHVNRKVERALSIVLPKHMAFDLRDRAEAGQTTRNALVVEAVKRYLAAA